jgi:type 1 glutamine amidotransferase/HEAT repeat protein
MKNVSRSICILAAATFSWNAVAYAQPASGDASDAPNRVIPAAAPEHISLIDAAVPAQARAKPKKPRNVLLTARTEGFFHTSIPAGLHALTQLGKKTGAYSVVVDHEMSAFSAESLRRFDAVIFFNTTQLKFKIPAHRQALLDFVRSGKGIAGIHAASDNFPEWPEGQALMGGVFHSHPWNARDVVGVKLDEPEHPLNRAFGGRGFWIQEEIYQIVGPYGRDRQRVLMSLDMSKAQNQRAAHQIVRKDGDFPIGWVKTEGAGRVFYSGLGHNEMTFWTPEVLQHYLDGIQFALGDLEASAIPSAKLAPAPKPALAAEPAITLLEKQNVQRIHDTAVQEKLATLQDGADNSFLRDISSGLRQSDAAGRARFEQSLVSLAQKRDFSLAAKRETADLLAWIGSARSVELLTRWASSAETADIAIRALGLIPGKESDQALIRLLANSNDAVRPAILDALGLRRSGSAVEAVKGQLGSANRAVAESAMNCLARIGTREALAALDGFKAPENLASTRTWALLAAAKNRMHAGDSRTAQKVFKQVLASHQHPAHRIAAAEGLIQSGGPEALAATEPLLAVQEDEIGIRVAPIWIRAAVQPNTGGTGKALAALEKSFAQLPAPTQLVLLNNAKQLGTPATLPLIRAGLLASDAEIRAAALGALGTCATELGQLEPLFAALMENAERDLAVGSLSVARAPGVDDKVRAAMEKADPSVRAALFTVAANRVDRAAMPAVLEGAKSQDRDLRQASFKAMGNLVRGEDLSTLLQLRADLKTPGERRAWNDAVLNAVRLSNQPVESAKLLAAHLPAAATLAERNTFAIALSLIDAPEADQVLARLLADADIERRKEVIRALSSARNPKAAQLLLQTAEKAVDETERVLALRGHVDALESLQMQTRDKVAAYRRAWKAATRDEERLAILSGVDKLHGNEAKALSKELHQALPSAPPAPSWLQ